jgi:hypothetical protein
MNTCVRVLSWVLASVSANSIAAAEPHAQLEFFRDAWTIKGMETSYSEVCDWLPGGGFLACRSEDRSEGEPAYSLSIFGYASIDAQYTYHGFAGSGTHRTLRGEVHDGVWRFHGESGRGPNWRRWQVTITPTDTGFLFREETSDRSGPWMEAASFEYLRRSQTGP